MSSERGSPLHNPTQVIDNHPPLAPTVGTRAQGFRTKPKATPGNYHKENDMTPKKVRFNLPAKAVLGSLALLALIAFGAPGQALASTAANAKITNTVTVNYQNTASVAQTPVSAQVDVTVTLVVTTPNISTPGDQTTAFGTPASYSYTLTATANGPATYNLGATVTAESGITGSTAATDVGSLTLGATTLAAATDGSATITVPYDGTSDGIVNGIAAGDTVVINGVAYTVDAGGITETPATNLATITLTSSVPAGVAAGAVVGEQQSFTLTVTPANDPAAQNNATITVQTTAQDSTNTAPAANDTTVTTVTVSDATLQVTKEVSVNGGAFTASATNAVPGDVLTYRIIVTNQSATANANSVVITDPAPQFTTYQAGSAKSSNDPTAVYATAANTTLTDTNGDGDGYDFGLTTGGTATYSVGNLAPSSSVVLFFQVAIQ